MLSRIGYISQFFSALATANGQGQIHHNCDWIERDVITYERVGGGTLGGALLAAIDNVNNMVWVDGVMNKAKSNVVNDNKLDPDDPPQSGSTVEFIDFDTSAGEIYDVETFLRNFAALGSYFDQTSAVFRTVAGNFQQLLSEATPGTVPDDTRSLPNLFNDWLRGLIGTYPSGCTTRATNAWRFYRREMEKVARDTNNGVVPNCFPLYTANVVRQNLHSTTRVFYLSIFSSTRDLIPAAPPLPHCNVPGTEGTVGYVGGGTTNFYAVGSGSSLTGDHYQALDASVFGAQCTNVYAMRNGATHMQGSLGSANIALQCGGRTGKQEVNFNWIFNGQALGCAALLGHGVTTIFCSANQGAALACAGHGAFTVQMRWFPS
ncbi:hypothetical protein FB45DRAFT_737413 [Roridomyces roridus]|uniref:Uncharacterized protein n=1 Tax=Roridomyces roridus TaxID=1738132 RepID=A0AAD7CAT3_9AGAR|nr:hypothetical protein FB45DRAFT_737413 [Roridomyces roridus]